MDTKEIITELRHRAWQERASARIGRTSKQRTAEHEHAAIALENYANDLERESDGSWEQYQHVKRTSEVRS